MMEILEREEKEEGDGEEAKRVPSFGFLSVTSRFSARTSLSRSLSVYNYRAANESSTNDRSTGSPD